MSPITRLELNRHPWSELRTIAGGTASHIPEVLEKIFSAEETDDLTDLYWLIENRVFVQSQLFRSAEFLVPVLMSSLIIPPPDYIKTVIFELLFQIFFDESHRDEDALGNTEIGDKCREKGREGIWLFYNELLYGLRESALEILELIETDEKRLNYYIEKSKK